MGLGRTRKSLSPSSKNSTAGRESESVPAGYSPSAAIAKPRRSSSERTANKRLGSALRRKLE